MIVILSLLIILKLGYELRPILLISLNVDRVIYQVFIDIEESSKMTAERLCKYLEQHGVFVMEESSSRFVLSFKFSII